jgi:hypothetical protein
LVRRPLMMVKKSAENSRALVLNETVGENYSPTSRHDIVFLVLTKVLWQYDVLTNLEFDYHGIQ